MNHQKTPSSMKNGGTRPAPHRLGWLCFLAVTASQAATGRPVAKVHECVIHYADISLSPELIRIDPVLGSLQGEELEQGLLSRERRELASRIVREIVGNVIGQHGITVTEEEVDAEYAKRTSRLSPEMWERIWRTRKSLIGALKMWHRKPDQEREIFEQNLAELMSYEAWIRYRHIYPNAESLRRIEQIGEDMKALSRRGLVRAVAEDKLREKVTRKVVVTEDEVHSRYQREYPKVSALDVVHIFHADQGTANAVYASLRAGGDLQEVLDSPGLRKGSEGGFVRERIQVHEQDPSAAALQRLRSDKVTAPTQYPVLGASAARALPSKMVGTGKLWYLTCLEEVHFAKDSPTLEDVRAKIREELQAEKAAIAWRRWLKAQIAAAEVTILDPRYADVGAAVLEFAEGRGAKGRGEVGARGSRGQGRASDREVRRAPSALKDDS